MPFCTSFTPFAASTNIPAQWANTQWANMVRERRAAPTWLTACLARRLGLHIRSGQAITSKATACQALRT
jgi:hypothetical protein